MRDSFIFEYKLSLIFISDFLNNAIIKISSYLADHFIILKLLKNIKIITQL